MELMRALAQSQSSPDFPPHGYAIANSRHMGPPLFLHREGGEARDWSEGMGSAKTIIVLTLTRRERQK